MSAVGRLFEDELGAALISRSGFKVSTTASERRFQATSTLVLFTNYASEFLARRNQGIVYRWPLRRRSVDRRLTALDDARLDQ